MRKASIVRAGGGRCYRQECEMPTPAAKTRASSSSVLPSSGKNRASARKAPQRADGGAVRPIDGRAAAKADCAAAVKKVAVAPQAPVGGATRARQGRTTNGDAFHLDRGARPWVALADGGEAAGVARAVLADLTAAAPNHVAGAAAAVVAALAERLSAERSCALAVMARSEEGFVGAATASARLFFWQSRGENVLELAAPMSETEGEETARAARSFSISAARGDVILALSDGAWRGLESCLAEVVADYFSAAGAGLWGLAAALLEAAGREGRPDDMTAVVLGL